MGYFGAFGFHPKSTGGSGSGSVTAVGAGTGMNFPTITGAGNVAIDTTKVPYFSSGFTSGFAKWNGASWVFDNNTYLTTSAAALTYYPLSNPAGYISSITSANVIAALGYVPYNSSNPAGYITGITSADVTSALGYTPVNKAGDTMTGYLILNADPIANLGAATKQYVDNISAGVNFHTPTYAASTTNLVTIYNNGALGVGATLTATSNGALILDGVDFSLLPIEPPDTYRVLIWQQTNQIQNGIYTVTQIGDGSNPFILTRATDADNSPTGELANGDFSLNQNGTLYGGYGFIMNAPNPITIGTSNVTYVQYNVAQAITAGFGLNEFPANTLNVDTGVIATVASLSSYLTTAAAALTYVPLTRNINTTSPLSGGGNLSGDLTLSISLANNTTDGYLSSTDWNTFFNKQSTISLTTSGTSGAATFIANTLNIPDYSGAFSGFVPYTGANQDVNLGTFNLITPIVYGNTIASGTLTLSSTSNATKGFVSFPDAGTNGIKVGGLVGSPFFSAIYLNVSSPSATNFSIIDTGGTLRLNSNQTDKFTSMFEVYRNGFPSLGSIVMSPTAFNINFDNANLGDPIAFQISIPNNTNQNAGFNIPNFKVVGGTKQWLTGTITNQYWNYFTANTAQFVGASTITNSYGVYIEAAIAGTNATITNTNNYALGLSGGNFLLTMALGGYIKMYDQAGIIHNIESNQALVLQTTTSYINLKSGSGGSISFATNGSSTQLLTLNSSNVVGNTTNQFLFNSYAQSGLLASTEVNTSLWNGANKTWQTGAITTQREHYIKSSTLNFATASTITNAYGLYVEAPTVGSNATITNNYAAGFLGNLIIRDALPITTLLNADLEVHKYANRDVVAVVRNDWQGASNIASAAVVIRSDSTTQLRMSMTSNSYATVGLITAGTAQLTTGGSLANRMLIGHATSSKDIIFVNGGTTATDEIFRISSFNTIDIYDARNLTFGTTTGTKFGTATSQKLGFFNATPIVQPPAVTTIQGLSTALSDLGLIAASTPSIWNVTTQSGASYSASNNDYVLVNASTQTITLPAPVLGRRVGVKVITSVTNIQVITNAVGVTIDGVDRSTIGLGIYNQWDAYTFVSSASAWYIES